MLKKLTLPAFVLAAALAFVAAPDSRLSAATCGGPGEILCTTNEDCASFFFFWKCTTRYDYWNEVDDGGDETPGDPDEDVVS